LDAIAALPIPKPTGAGMLVPAPASPALEETAETAPDTAIAVADNLAKRTEFLLVDGQIRAQQREIGLDRLRMSFDATQKEHAELLREMNALRDMATEQMKQDDANLKKWIALI
jgi:hypothetical protein